MYLLTEQRGRRRPCGQRVQREALPQPENNNVGTVYTTECLDEGGITSTVDRLVRSAVMSKAVRPLPATPDQADRLLR